MNSKTVKAMRRYQKGMATSEDMLRLQAHFDSKKNTGQAPKIEEPRKRRRVINVGIESEVGRNPDGTRRVWRAGEPLIVVKPIRAIAVGKEIDEQNAIIQRGINGKTPKHILDKEAL